MFSAQTRSPISSSGSSSGWEIVSSPSQVWPNTEQISFWPFLNVFHRFPDRSRHRGRHGGHQKAARVGQSLFGRFAGGFLPADFRNQIAACSEVLPRALPLAAVFSLPAAGLPVAASVDDMSVFGAPDFRTPGYCVFSWPFVALSAAGLLLIASPAARAGTCPPHSLPSDLPRRLRSRRRSSALWRARHPPPGPLTQPQDRRAPAPSDSPESPVNSIPECAKLTG